MSVCESAVVVYLQTETNEWVQGKSVNKLARSEDGKVKRKVSLCCSGIRVG